MKFYSKANKVSLKDQKIILKFHFKTEKYLIKQHKILGLLKPYKHIELDPRLQV